MVFIDAIEVLFLSFCSVQPAPHRIFDARLGGEHEALRGSHPRLREAPVTLKRNHIPRTDVGDPGVEVSDGPPPVITSGRSE